MKKTKFMSLIAGVLVASFVLGGCAGSNAGTNASSESVAVSGVNEFPITEEPVTLSVFTGKSVVLENVETNAFTKWYEEKTNVKILWDFVSGDAQQSINLQLASDDYSDVFLGFDFARSEQTAYYDQGVFIDMSELIDKHAYYIKEMFKINPDIEKAIRHTDNMILGIPNFNQDFSAEASDKMWVYKPWMDKLGAKMPETTDDLYELLKRFKTEDPNGNGVDDEIPLAGRGMRGNPVGLDMFIMNAFTQWTRFGFYNNNGKAEFAPIKGEAKEGLKYMRKLYSEGLIHPDSFVMDRARITSIAESETPILGAGTGKWTTQFTLAGAASGRAGEYVAIPPLKGPTGIRRTLYGQQDPGCTWFSITSNCKNPEVAVKWIDWFYSNESYLKTRASDGIRKAEDGEIGLDGQQALYVIEPVEENMGGAIQNERWLSFAPGFTSLEENIRIKDNTIDAQRQQNAYEAYKLYEPYTNKGIAFVDFPVPSEDSEEYLELRANITAAIDSGVVGFIIGEKSIEDDWDAYVDNFYRLGLERYMEIVQNYLDSTK